MIGDAPVEALSGEGGEFDLGDVEQGAVAGRVVDLQSLCQCERRGEFECLVEGADAVGVEVVHDEHNGLGVGVVVGEQVLHLTGQSILVCVVGRRRGASRVGVRPDEDRAGAVADVLAVFFLVMPGLGVDRVANLLQQLVGLLVHAHHRPARIMGSGVDGQDVFHPSGELGIGMRWDRPALLQMRTKFRFFSTRPMVEWSRSGRSASEGDVPLQQAQRPARVACGGLEQASAISRASTAPVTIGATGGVSRGLRRSWPARRRRSREPFRNRTHGVLRDPNRSAITADRPPDQRSHPTPVIPEPHDHPCRMHAGDGQLGQEPRSAADRPIVNTFGEASTGHLSTGNMARSIHNTIYTH